MATRRDTVRKIIAEKLSVDLEQVVPDASFQDNLGADSLDLVEMVMGIEEEFEALGLDIDDEDAKKLTTVGAVYDHLEEKGIDLDAAA